jgi:hypothetical protein
MRRDVPFLGVFGRYPSCNILKKTAFRKLNLFPFSGERLGGTNCVGVCQKELT